MAHDDDGRRPDGGGSPVGGEPFDWEHFVVPDDARELDADVRAYRREMRAQSQGGIRRFVPRNKRGVVGSIALAVVVLSVAFTSLVMIFPRPRDNTVPPDPLAHPATTVGAEGGLVPDLRVERETGRALPLRSLRPAVLMLVPEGCDCTDPARSVLTAAQRHRYLTVLIGTPVPEHPDPTMRGEVVRVSEPGAQLAKSYELGDDPVLLLVRADGVIDQIVNGVPSDDALSSALIKLGEQSRQR